MIPHFEEAAGHDIRVITIVQYIEERLRIAAFESREDAGSVIGQRALDPITIAKKIANKGPVPLQ